MTTAPDPAAFTRPRGFQDRVGGAARQARAIELGLRRLFARWGYVPVDVPTLEYIDLYHRDRIGDALFHGLVLARLSDAAEFPARDTPAGLDDPGEAVHEVALRPEFTAPVARMVVSALAGRPEAPDLPIRLYYGGRVFRELGVGPLQLREFTQVGVELVGGPSGPADLEVLLLACDGAAALGLPDSRLRLGHAGLCRALLEGMEVPGPALRSVAFGLERATRLRRKAAGPADAWARYAAARAPELARRASEADCAAFPAVRGWSEADPDTLAEQLPAAHAAWLRRTWCGRLGLSDHQAGRLLDLADHAGAPDAVLPALHGFATTGPARAALDELAALCEQLAGLRETPIEVSATASRGIAYYTGVSFELHSDATGAAFTDVAGGGRYDDLHRWIQRRAAQTARVRGQELPASAWLEGGLGGVGLSFGVERVAAALASVPPGPMLALVLPDGPAHLADAVRMADRIRATGVAAALAWTPAADPVAAARDRAARFAVTVGPDSAELIDLAAGTRAALAPSDLPARLRACAEGPA